MRISSLSSIALCDRRRQSWLAVAVITFGIALVGCDAGNSDGQPVSSAVGDTRGAPTQDLAGSDEFSAKPDCAFEGDAGRGVEPDGDRPLSDLEQRKVFLVALDAQAALWAGLERVLPYPEPGINPLGVGNVEKRGIVDVARAVEAEALERVEVRRLLIGFGLRCDQFQALFRKGRELSWGEQPAP